LHYWLKASIFADVTAACDDDICYVRNDRAESFLGEMRVWFVEIATGDLTLLKNVTLNLSPGPASMNWFFIAPIDGSTHVMVLDIENESHNVQLHLPPKGLKTLPKDSGLSFAIADSPSADGSIDIYVTAKVPVALFVTFTTLAHGRFSDNAFLLISQKSPKVIQFIPFGDLDMDTLKASLRVEDLATYGTYETL